MPGLTATSSSFEVADIQIVIPGPGIGFRSRGTLLFRLQNVAHLGTRGVPKRSMTTRSGGEGGLGK